MNALPLDALQRPLTYDDLFHMPEDGKRRELIGGELIVNPAPRRAHQDISTNVHWILQQYLRASGAGRSYAHPVDVYIGPNDVVQPDLIAIRNERLGIYRPEGVVIAPPDIVVEILSPSSQRTDRVSKMALYARFGVPEYWIVDPEAQRFAMNVLADLVYKQVDLNADGRCSSQSFPGLHVDPAEIFHGLNDAR